MIYCINLTVHFSYAAYKYIMNLLLPSLTVPILLSLYYLIFSILNSPIKAMDPAIDTLFKKLIETQIRQVCLFR